MLKLFAAASLAGLAAAPAAAVTYDAFTSFNAVNGTGGFVYGSADTNVFTPFVQNTGCVIGGVICLRGAIDNLPSVFESTSNVTTMSGSVILPTDRLVVHPGANSDSVYVAFAVTRQGSYSYSAEFNQQDVGNGNTPHSVGITEFYTPFGGATQYFSRVVVDGTTPDIFTGFTAGFYVGDVFGYVVDKDGVYFNDSTGVNFSVTPVPEPATWTLMIAGFGLAGAALRRRAALAA